MIFDKLFVQQEQLEKEIITDINNGKTRICILGTSGCGKTHLTEYIIRKIISANDNWMVFNFVGDLHCLEKDYYPLISGLDSYCQKYNVTKAVKQAVPKLLEDGSTKGTFFSYILGTILNRASENELYINKLFDDAEIDILYKIKSCINGKKCLIYMDNLHWWDPKSIHFIYMLLKFSRKYIREMEDSILICNITTDQTNPNKEIVNTLLSDFAFVKYAFRTLTIDEYQKCLVDIGLNINSPEIVKILYKLTNQNLAITKRALMYPESISGILSRTPVNENDLLKILIEKRLTELGATGEQITEVLKYASLLGYAFSLVELEYLVPYNDAKVGELVEKANELSLVKSEKRLYHFTHEVIRELFRKKMEENKYVYWERTVLCLKTLHPYDYKTRIKYLLKMGNIPEIEKIYVLDIFDQLEKTCSCEINFELDILLSEEIKEYIENIKIAFNAYQNGQYAKAIRFAKSIENIYPIELLAIRDLLISQCLTKELSGANRKKAVDIIQNYSELYHDFREKQLWTKTMMCLLTAYIHVRDAEKAQLVLNQLYSFYNEHAKICDDYKKELNILRRKSTPFYELEVAAIYLKRSVSFFAPETREMSFILYPRQYFMSLVNYSSNQICSGNFTKGFDMAQTAIDLYNKMPGMRFPRVEIAINNYLLAGFLSKQMEIKDTILSYRTLLDKLVNVADKTIIETNLAALYLMNFQKDDAIELLDILNRDIENSQCKEFSYIYHVKINLLIIAILDCNWSLAKVYLKALEDIVPNLYQNYYFLKKHRLLSQLVLQCKKIVYDEEFSQFFLRENSSNDLAWKFYGILPAFNTLEYWSEP